MKLTGKKANLFIFIAFFCYLVAYVGRYSYSSVLVVLKDIHGEDVTGLVTMFLFFSYGGGQLVSGLLSKKFNSVYLVAIGLTVSTACNLVLPLFINLNFNIVKFVWLVNGFAQSLLWCNLVKLISLNLEEKKISSTLIIMTFSVTLGTFLSYALSAWFINAEVYQAIFYTAGGLMAVGVVFWLIINLSFGKGRKGEQTSEEAPKNEVVLTERVTSKTPFVFFIISLFIAAIGAGFIRDGVQTWFPTILKDVYGMDGSLSTLLSLALPLVSLVGVVIGQKVTDHMKRPALSSGVALIGTALLVLVVTLTLNYKIVALVIACFAVSVMLMNIVVHNSTGVMPFRMKNYIHVGFISGLLDSFIYVGSGVATYALGALSGVLGWNEVFTIIIIVAGVLGVISLIGSFINVKTESLENKTLN